MTQDEMDEAKSPFSFGQEHESSTHQAVCQLVFQAASGAPTLSASLPDEVAKRQVSGAFVTLKCDQKLRSCYGCFGGPFGLTRALEQASLGAATKDPRFPLVRVDELPRMHVEVSLLYNIQPVAERGLRRREAVTVGRHGLTVRTADRSGLLLPRVATDFGLNAEGFLQQVCIKAGLKPDKWPDNDVELQTFEAHCFGAIYRQVATTGE